jgi:hypothetical protein
MRNARFVATAIVVLLLAPAGAVSPETLVICAPGYPGTTAQARPVMEAFAGAAARAAGWAPGSLAAVYYEKAEPGLVRLAQEDAALALVPLPFYLQNGPTLRLAPRLAVVRDRGATETWSLVAKKGTVSSAAALAGFEVASGAGYSPAFVRGPVLGAWGALPKTATIKFTPSILSALRRAAAGEKVAVLLDSSQTTALASLPFAGDLATVYRGKPLPGTLLCTVGDRAKRREFDALFKALLGLHKTTEGADALAAMQMARFETAELSAIEAAGKAFTAALGSLE